MWTAAAFPVAVLSHEFAHYGLYRLFGFGSPVLHYGSANFQRADEFWNLMESGEVVRASSIVNPVQAGAAAAAGIVATFVAIAVALWINRKKPHPFWSGLALIAPLRFIGSLFVIVAAIFGRRGNNGSDEAHAALVFQIPEMLLHVIGAAILAATWVTIFRINQRAANFSKAAIMTGVVAGGFLYIVVLGPMLIP